MNLPDFMISSSWKASLNPEFIRFNDVQNWSPERLIERLWHTAYDVLYKNDVESGKITQEFAEKKLQALNHAYGSVKHKFQDIERNNGWRYFDHQLRVAYNILTKSKKPSLRKVLIALHHDSIEDTDYDFHTLETTLNMKIALWVDAISKRPFTEFARRSTGQVSVRLSTQKTQEIRESGIIWVDGVTLSDEYLTKKYFFPDDISDSERIYEKMWRESLTDIDKFNIIERSGILNRKGLLSDKYISKKNFKADKIRFREIFAEELYEELNKKYKNIRNDEYFSHMVVNEYEKWNRYVYEEKLQNSPCLNKFYAHVTRLIEKNRVHIEDDVLLWIVLDALEVKFWDRIDNLETTEVYEDFSPDNIKKAYRKINETECYFYKIAQEYDALEWTQFYEIISTQVQKLQAYITQKEQMQITQGVKNDVSEIVVSK